jgi:hypothetical protein
MAIESIGWQSSSRAGRNFWAERRLVSALLWPIGLKPFLYLRRLCRQKEKEIWERVDSTCTIKSTSNAAPALRHLSIELFSINNDVLVRSSGINQAISWQSRLATRKAQRVKMKISRKNEEQTSRRKTVAFEPR